MANFKKLPTPQELAAMTPEQWAELEKAEKEAKLAAKEKPFNLVEMFPTLITEERLAEIRAKNEAQRIALTEEYQEKFPGVEITKTFLFDLMRAIRFCEPCAQCNGTKCLKEHGFRYMKYKVAYTEVYNSLEVMLVPCFWRKKLLAEAKADIRLKQANIPYRFIEPGWGEYQTDSGNMNAYKWGRHISGKGYDEVNGLYLFGDPGVGKTFLAALIGKELIKQGKRVLFQDTPTLLDKLRDTFNGGDKSLNDVMQELSNVEVLILDDIGTEKATEWAIEQLYTLINNRYEEPCGLMTILTSNYSLDELEERFTTPKNNITCKRITSRLEELCKIVMVDGKDRRRRKR